MNQLLLILIAFVCIWLSYKTFFSPAGNDEIILDDDASWEEKESYARIQNIIKEKEKFARETKHFESYHTTSFLQQKINVLNEALEAEKQHFKALRKERRKADK